MLMRLRHLAAFALLAAAPFRGGAAQSGSAQMTGTVMTAITITGSDLRFGNILRTQTKTVAPAAGGRFVVTMAANTPVTISYVVPASLGPNVTLSSWTALYNVINDPASALFVPLLANSGSYVTSTPTGGMYIWLGATVTTLNAAVGNYSQPIRLTLTYN